MLCHTACGPRSQTDSGTHGAAICTPCWAVIARASRGFTSAGLQIAASPSLHCIASRPDSTRTPAFDPTRPVTARRFDRRSGGPAVEEQKAAEGQKATPEAKRARLSIYPDRVRCTLEAWHLICMQERIRSPARSPSRRRSPGPGGPPDTHLPRSPRRDATVIVHPGCTRLGLAALARCSVLVLGVRSSESCCWCRLLGRGEARRREGSEQGSLRVRVRVRAHVRGLSTPLRYCRPRASMPVDARGFSVSSCSS